MKISLLRLTAVWVAAAVLLPAQVPTYSIRTLAGTSPPGDGGFAVNAVLSAGLGKVTTDSAGNAYFVGQGRVRRVGVDGLLTTVAGGGSGSTPALQASLSQPYALAVDSPNQLLYIGELGATIRRVNLRTGAIQIIAGNGTFSSGPDGPALTTPIFEVTGLALDSTGGLLFSERYGYRVRRLDLAASTVKTIIGTGTSGAGADGLPATQTAMSYTEDVALDSKGNIFVLDSGCVVRKIDPATNVARIVAGSLGNCGYAGDGVPPLSAHLDTTLAIALNAAGDLFYLTEGSGVGGGSNRVRKVDLGNNRITTYAGIGTTGDSGDGGLATQALLAWPAGIALNKDGTVLVSEYIGGRVRLIDASQRIQPFAGVSNPARGDGGPALAALLSPDVVAPDGKGGLVISDDGNRRVRAISNGVISLVAGTDYFHGSSGDGGLATSAGLFVVYGMAVDPAGPIYISESTGEVRVISGNIIKAASKISFNFPQGIALDPTHRFLYIAEYSGQRVVRLDVSTGLATTIAGIGNPGDMAGFSGDDGDNVAATQAHLNGPGDLAVDASGNVYVMDTVNHVIRRINPSANTMVTVAGNHKARPRPRPMAGWQPPLRSTSPTGSQWIPAEIFSSPKAPGSAASMQSPTRWPLLREPALPDSAVMAVRP